MYTICWMLGGVSSCYPDENLWLDAGLWVAAILSIALGIWLARRTKHAVLGTSLGFMAFFANLVRNLISGMGGSNSLCVYHLDYLAGMLANGNPVIWFCLVGLNLTWIILLVLAIWRLWQHKQKKA